MHHLLFLQILSLKINFTLFQYIFVYLFWIRGKCTYRSYCTISIDSAGGGTHDMGGPAMATPRMMAESIEIVQDA